MGLGFLAAAGLIALAQSATLGALFLLLSLVAGPFPLTLAAGFIAVGVKWNRRPDAK
ncbi:hypothetical protein LGT39_04865 [Demequina sp. TTPB684]|nr:hypothetical protein [Demequina sp. TTPB684]